VPDGKGWYSHFLVTQRNLLCANALKRSDDAVLPEGTAWAGHSEGRNSPATGMQPDAAPGPWFMLMGRRKAGLRVLPCSADSRFTISQGPTRVLKEM
jgi:hypothetical protein